MADEDAKTTRSGRPGVVAPGTEGHKRRASRSGRGAEDYTKTTRDIRVSVRSYYLEDQSQPDENHFVWAYRVKIENRGREPVQLLRRTWQIMDANGRTQHVHGAGVMGEQPVLEPGEAF
jgi:ApaG protein